jgi:high-affinity nickel-transport protein
MFGWFTIALLVAIGVINLWSLRHSHASDVAAGGIRSRLLRGLLGSQHPGAIFAVCALFALSFETMTQASVFALGAGGGSAHASPAAVEAALIWWLPLALGITFTAGMIVTDSVNGLWLYRLASNTQARSASAMRRLALAIAALSFAMAGWAAVRMLSPGIDAWFEGSELLLGFAVLAVVATGYLLAMRTAAPVAPDAAPLLRGDRP